MHPQNAIFSNYGQTQGMYVFNIEECNIDDYLSLKNNFLRSF